MVGVGVENFYFGYDGEGRFFVRVVFDVVYVVGFFRY